jgi:hypothetical protein
MADLYITEYRRLGGVNASVFPAPLEPAITVQKVAFTTSTQSAPLNSGTSLVMVSASAKAHIAFGTNPTATTSGTQIPQDTPMFFSVESPDLKIAAVVAV